MKNAPICNIDVDTFWKDPYPVLERLRHDMPVAYVPQLGAILLTRHADISTCEKNTEVFSSHQPDGLMNKLMGQNMMRKDGDTHLQEKRIFMQSLSPKRVKSCWQGKFQDHMDSLLDRIEPNGSADVVAEIAMPLSAEALKSLTGLLDADNTEFDAWSQAMIDGIANYPGDVAVETRCIAATEAIDTAIDALLSNEILSEDQSLLASMQRAGAPVTSIRANIKLAISGGQNEPRDAIAGTIWSLLTHPDQLVLINDGKASWRDAFSEYVRWNSPIGMSPRRINKPHVIHSVELEPDDKVFLMFSSANRDERVFQSPEEFDITRDTRAHIAFGAGPHFCVGAAASSSLISDVALPSIFARLPNLALSNPRAPQIGGWAFRGLSNLDVIW